MRKLCFSLILVFSSVTVAQAEQPPEPDSVRVTDQSGDEQSRVMSGMSILGNEEAPKSLVIVPWKSSQLGDEVDMSNILGDKAEAVDKEVFLRQLRFYQLRATSQSSDTP